MPYMGSLLVTLGDILWGVFPAVVSPMRRHFRTAS